MSRLSEIVTDLAGVAGASLITFGVWRIYDPAAFIVGGAFLLVGAWLAARRSA
jgi:hypothetical protein